MRPALVSACIQRCGAINANFDAYLSIRRNTITSKWTNSIDLVTAGVLDNSALCNKFELSYDNIHLEMVTSPVDDLDQLTSLARPMDLPSVSELSIIYPRKLCELYRRYGSSRKDTLLLQMVDTQSVFHARLELHPSRVLGHNVVEIVLSDSLSTISHIRVRATTRRPSNPRSEVLRHQSTRFVPFIVSGS